MSAARGYVDPDDRPATSADDEVGDPLSEEENGNRTPAVAFAVAACAGAVTVASTWLPWVIARTPLASWSLTVSTAHALLVLALAPVLAVLAAMRWSTRELGPARLTVAGLIAIGAAAVFAFMAVPAEVVSSLAARWLPELLPNTFRRVSFDVVAGPGLWIAVAGCLTMAVAATTSAWTRLGLALATAQRLAGRAGVLAFAFLGVALCAFVAARYLPWWTASGEIRWGKTALGVQQTSGDLDVSGWMLPFAGLSGLVAIGLMCAGLAGSLMAPGLIAPLVAVAGGWLASFAGGSVIVLADVLPGRLDIGHQKMPLLESISVDVLNHGAAVGAWVSLAAGLGAAWCGISLLSIKSRAQREGIG